MYWHLQILSDLARCIGVPLKFDANTIAGEVCHFAWVFVDVDVSFKLLGSIMLHR